MVRSRFRQELRTSERPIPLAELRARGVTRGQAQGPRWRMTSQGFYVPGTANPDPRSPTQRILDVVPLIPRDGALTGWAAAFVHGVDLLDGLDGRTMAPVPVPICCPHNPGRIQVPHVRYVRGSLPPNEICVIEGVRVASPLRAAFDGARFATDLQEAVVFADAVAHLGLVDLEQLSRYVAGHPGWKGVRQAARAVALADRAARSPGESRLRVLYMLEAGLPRPEVNLPIFNLQGGLLGIGDLLDEEAGLVTEYDGNLHRERFRHHNDNIREEAFERAGLVVVRADAVDLKDDHTEVVRRLLGGYQDGLARDRRRDRWTVVEPQWWIDQQDPMELLTPEQRADIFDLG